MLAGVHWVPWVGKRREYSREGPGDNAARGVVIHAKLGRIKDFALAGLWQARTTPLEGTGSNV